ncbi:MAG TPA: peptidoglycan DD-metalloendopeptidase family protein [Rhodanobacteraceae bacterium]|nr:peptidoglycan DD-metalloendopeptidase family protein [Rhodanobacteraceae bacterium]
MHLLPISRWRRHLPATALCALMSLAGSAHADEPPGPSAKGAHTEREAAAKARLAEVRAEIAKIAKAQHTTAAKRDAIDAKLADQAAQLNQIANAVRDTDAAIAARSASLADLERQHAQLEQELSGQRAALADLLRATYTLDRGSDLSLLLGDDDIAKINRALAYSRYFQHDRVARIRALLGEVAQLDDLEASIEIQTEALKQQREQRSTQAAQLQQARASQQKLLADADAQLAQQKGKIAALQHDADALNQLLKQLQNVFADIPAQLGRNAPFVQLRGKLAWPVVGKSHAGTGTLAQGVVIAAKPGAEVHAVAYGRVAWANFLRGYGMLVIIDHGDGWMSLYGGNEAALVEAGDWVKPGQPIATVGRDPEQGGAWFGLRRDGKPVDPQGWFAARR